MKRLYAAACLVFCALLFVGAPARAADDALSAAANSAFLAANAAKPGTVTRPSGLQYRILKTGVGKRPGGDDIVHIYFSIALINGAVVDSTSPTLPAAMAMSSVNLRGLGEALALMHDGDRWRLVVPPALALGVKGTPNGAVPPNQVLVMDVTLVSSAAPRPGEAAPENPFSTWSNGREMGGAVTIHP